VVGSWDGPQLVVFDLAGTTVEDRGQVPAAFVAALAQHGIEVRAEQVAAVRGSSKRQAILELLPDGPERPLRADALYAAFRVELARRYERDGARPVPGAEATFRWLHDRGALIALNTGFDRDTTDLLLASLGWSKLANAVVCADDVEHGRPAPDLILRAMEATGTRELAVVANVGDTTRDLEAGHAAGVRWNIGVTSGAHDEAWLRRAPHTHLVASVAELPGIWLPAV
jgi:phosphonatase-like hydrolase